MQVGIVGASGYTGGELLRILSTHPEVEISFATSREHAGKKITNLHPNLKNILDLEFTNYDLNKALECDAVFLSLPHKTSFNYVGDLINSDVKIIDLSADFRIKNIEEYKKYYDIDHPRPDLLKQAVLGIPELHRNEIKKAKLVACPGCISTTVTLGMYPLAKEIKEFRLVADVKIGSSAGGRKPEQANHHAERANIVRPYSPMKHRHLAEIEQETGLRNIGISCHAIDAVRGILATCHVLTDNLLAEKDLWKIYRKHYGDEFFIRLVAKREGGLYSLPDPKTVVYSNFCDIGWAIDDHSNRIIIFSALDNLMKGASGQAVQCMNAMFNLDEKTGLRFPASYL